MCNETMLINEQYHDDGESTLGPTIATLSLGGQAKMMIRMKAKYYFGITKSGVYNPLAPVLPGCKGYAERVELNSLNGKISKEAFEEAKKTLCKNLRQVGSPPPLLTMYIKHGDMIVMHGAEMQKYYEVYLLPPSQPKNRKLKARSTRSYHPASFASP
jgi:hypothetical protein